jgi:hypothetical protein
MSSLSFEPLIPGSLWMALAVAGVALLAWYALRRPEAIRRGRWALVILLMGTAMATVFGVLLNPTWVRELPPPAGKPLLSVLVDDSGSMTVPDGGGAKAAGGTRYEAAAKIAKSLSSNLQNQFDVQVRTFSESTKAVGMNDLAAHEPKGQSTDLATAVADVLADDRPQGQAVVVLSDGIHNAAGGAQPVLDAVRRAKSLAAPVYTRTVGGGGTTIDLAIELRSPQDMAFIGQRVPVTVRATGRGVRGGQADVTLLYNGKEVGRQPVTLNQNGSSPEVRFWVKQDKMGLYPYEARIDPLPGEATQANNSATYLLRVIDQPIKVLLVEGKPYWDSKFLMRTLASVPAVELESLVRVTDGRLVHRKISRKDQPTPKADAGGGAASSAAPVAVAAADESAGVADVRRAETWEVVGDAGNVFADAERLRGFQVVVLGREAEAFLTDPALTNLQQWVSKDGGALVCSRGAPTVQVNQRLAKLLPVKWTPGREERFRIRLTDDGRDLHWLGEDAHSDGRLAGLPTLASSAQVDRSKPLAVVLATGVAPGGEGASGGGAPAVIYQPYGGGRVVVIEGAGMWRWAFLPPQYQQQDEVYASLWHSMLRWVTGSAGLLPGQKLALRADKISFATDESATATLLVREETAAAAAAGAGSGNAPTAVGSREIELIGSEAGAAPKSFTASVLGEEPGNFRVSFGKLPAGRYQARVAGAGVDDVASRCVFDVRVIGQEQLDLQARPDLMARIAADGGGAVLTEDATAAAGQIAKTFKEHLARTRPPRHERATAWDRPWILLAVFGLWAASWAVRRSGGLV